MLTLSREEGQTIYLGERLHKDDMSGTCDVQIDFARIDHRVGHRCIEVIVASHKDVTKHILTPRQNEVVIAPGILFALLGTHEYMNNGAMRSVARIGLRAPRSIRIMRDNLKAE